MRRKIRCPLLITRTFLPTTLSSFPPLQGEREGPSESMNTPLCPLIYTLSHDGRRTSPQTAGPARDQDDGQRRGAAARATH